MSHQDNLDSLYANSFERFLEATNEKDAVVAALSHTAIKYGDTILDIGAGNGELASKIIERYQPSTYVGIELNTAFHEPLSAAGVEVIPDSYPTADSRLNDARFGTVLTSYSMPLTNPSRTDFLQTAFERTRPADGTLAIVSFANHDQWSEVSEEINRIIGHAIPSDEPAGQPETVDFLNELQQECAELGHVQAGIFTSEIGDGSVEKLFDSIAFVATAGLKSALQEYYHSKKDVMAILHTHAPEGIITQSHSLVTVDRKSPDVE